MSDVAEAAGVSNATVSNVIHDKQNVSEKTRRRVRGVIEELNYRPTALAQRHLSTPPQRSIGLIVKEISNPYFANVVVGAQEAARAAGCNLVVGTSEGQRDVENCVVESFVSHDFHGLIINPLLDDNADLSHLFELKRRNIPLVLLERVHGLRADLVDVDNATYYKRAVKYLIELGHEKVMHFAGPEYSIHSRERIEAFQTAFFESGLIYNDHLVVEAGASLYEGFRAGMDYFTTHGASLWPTAVACYNDVVAIGLMRALRKQDISIPEQVAIIGFDNVDMCKYAPVPLTSIGVPRKKLGLEAVKMLLRRMETPNHQTPEQMSLQAEMTVRASTAPPDATA